ncbi:MAG TPA: 2-oxoglutarate dehydrogenase complex dihydrolipoyllysine-residue succinyltransferase [Alphaproteobacteria bacterium]|nr:2-oxoglutarate dehydrogenase complex dihydrolipoyllysine-residue succinyltransferase [Alphaproteobacteria bacterium]
MPVEIRVPTLGESVTEATVAKWLKKVGDSVRTDEPLVELETDKVTLEVNATASGTISEIAAQQGNNVKVGALLGMISEGAGAAAKPPANANKTQSPAAAPVAAAPPPPPKAAAPSSAAAPLSPGVRKMVDDNKLDPSSIPASGREGRLTSEDVINYLNAPKAAPAAKAPAAPSGPRAREAQEERVLMTRLRQRIAERLKEAQNTAAMLTTFNEVDMGQLMALRKTHGEAFEKKYGVKLGFMSFFVKACIQALKAIPAVNGEIDGEDLVYKNYYDIGVAVGTEQGLVVPVVREADRIGFADIEKTIAGLAKKAREGKLSIAELTGGTFTITNGGIYGSLMSTPILNPPQSGILGMHKIQERPMVVNGQVVARPMMYIALSYDHRIIDGREAVTFLVKVKEALEDPQRLLLEV